MSQISSEDALIALRTLMGAKALNIDPSIRQYAFAKFALGASSVAEDSVIEFSERMTVPIIDDVKFTQKIALEKVASLVKLLEGDVDSWFVGTEGKLQSMREKLNAWQIKNNVVNTHSSPEKVQQEQERDLLEYWIPVTAAYSYVTITQAVHNKISDTPQEERHTQALKEDEVLSEAVHRTVYDKELDPEHTEILKRRSKLASILTDVTKRIAARPENGDMEINLPPVAQLQESLLYCIGCDALAHPASHLNIEINEAVFAFDDIYFNIDLSTEEKAREYQRIIPQLEGLKQIVAKVNDNISTASNTTISLPEETIQAAEKLATFLANTQTNWRKNHEQKMQPTVNKFDQTRRSFAGEERQWADVLFESIPLPLGGDPSLPRMIEDFATSLHRLKEKIAGVKKLSATEAEELADNNPEEYRKYRASLLYVNTPEFQDFHNALSYLKERMYMPMHRKETVNMLLNGLTTNNTELSKPASDGLIAFCREALAFSETVANGSGNTSAPTSPKSAREQVENVCEQVNNCLEALDGASLTFARFTKPLETILQFCKERYSLEASVSDTPIATASSTVDGMIDLSNALTERLKARKK